MVAADQILRCRI